MRILNSKQLVCLSTVLALIVPPLMGLASTADASAQVTIEQASGDSAVATFHSVDSSGCVITDTFVFASVGEIHDPPGAPAEFQITGVGLSQFDQCQGLLLKTGLGSSRSALSFQLARDMSSATLSATVPVAEFVSGTTFNVSVSLNWTGTGDAAHQASNSHERAPGYTAQTHFNGTFRAGQASGSVSDGVTNYAVGPSIDVTFLEQSSNGEVSVQHN
jgi:hypothetical protein